MLIRPFPILALALLSTGSSNAVAQNTSACACNDLLGEVLQDPDTVFHVTEGFDVAYCGHIDRTVQPFVYSEFTMRSCGRVHGATLDTRAALQECHLYVEHAKFIVEELALLPTGADMHLERRPSWRTPHWLFVADDSSAAAIAGPMTDLIATFQEPTPEQVADIQHRLDAMKPSVYWTDEELLGQVFLCGLFDPVRAKHFEALRETFLLGGAVAELYGDLLRVLHEKRAGNGEQR